METTVRTRFLRLISIILLCLTLISLVAFFSYRKNQFSFVKNLIDDNSKQIQTEKIENEKQVKAKIYTDERADYWEIMDSGKKPNFPTGIKFFKKDIPEQTVARWKNYLIGINFEKYLSKNGATYFDTKNSETYSLQSKIDSINVYDIDAGQNFTIPLDQPIWGNFLYVANQVVDNAYYFGVGGAFGPMLSYKLDLPPKRTSRIVKFDAIGNEIKKIGNSYVSSFCYEGCTYSLFDPTSLTSVSLERMTQASNMRDMERKEELIGIDGRGQMLLKNKNTAGEIESITASPLNNQKVTNTLLKVTSSPEKGSGYFTIEGGNKASLFGRGEYFMVDGINKILVFGRFETYIYDLTKKQFKEIKVDEKLREDLFATQEFKADNIYKGSNNTVCFSSQNKQPAINLVTETYSGQSTDCQLVRDTSKSIEEMFKDLNLPDTFSLIQTPLTYKTYHIEKIPESKVPFGAEVIE